MVDSFEPSSAAPQAPQAAQSPLDGLPESATQRIGRYLRLPQMPQLPPLPQMPQIPQSEIINRNREQIERRLRDVGERVVEEIYLDDDNDEEVEHFKYQQKLKKKFSVASIVGLGFSLMNVPFGISTTLSVGLVCGGSFTILWGWVLFGIFTTLISMSLSEIASKFPTSGGVYHFSYLLSNDRWSSVMAWFDGWFLIIGNWLMFVSCAFGGAQFVLSIFGLKESNYRRNDWAVFVVFLIIVALSAFVNLQFQSQLEKFNKLCIYWTVYTILIMDFLLLLFSTDYHDLHYILTHFDASRSGWPNALAFLIGAIQFPAMTFNGYGSITSMSEEVNDPERTIPKGMIFAVLISVFTGLSFILPVLTILPDLGHLLDDNPDIFPIDIIFKLSTRSFLVSMVLVLMIAGALTFATVGSLTTASRVVYAFGRDHGLPFDDLWQEVDTMGKDDELVPKNALLLSVGVSCVLGLFSLVSSSAFTAFVGCSVIALNIANGIPILCSILNKRRKIRGAVFKLRKFGYLVNGLSIIFIVMTMVFLSFPPSRYINLKSMNYAFPVFFTFALIIWLLWLAWGRSHFQGPEIDHEDFAERTAVPMENVSKGHHQNDGDETTVVYDIDNETEHAKNPYTESTSTGVTSLEAASTEPLNEASSSSLGHPKTSSPEVVSEEDLASLSEEFVEIDVNDGARGSK